MSTLLSLRGAAFGYEGRAVVSGVDLTVQAGEFLGIVGPNGAGKTTLFRGILGLLPTLAGTRELGAKAIGYVPQRDSLDALYPLSVREVVEMGSYSRLRGVRLLRREERSAASAALARVGLAGKERANFAALSGGQRQRALIARALLVRPDFLLLDEPTSGVDREAQREILALLLELNREQQLAILLVSHQLGIVREAVHEILWVADGRVLRGSTEELLAPDHLDRLFLSNEANESRESSGASGRSGASGKAGR